MILPPSFTETVASESNILPHVRLCQVANGICLDEYVSLSIQEVVFENELQIIVDVDSNQVADGMYSMQVQIQDQLLTFSNNLTNYILIDQNAPTVRLNSVDSVLESESIVVDIDIDDSYSGSSYVTTWTITEPMAHNELYLKPNCLLIIDLNFKHCLRELTESMRWSEI